MKYLANVTEPHDDELWLGYTSRLAQMNGFKTAAQFIGYYFYDSCKIGRCGWNFPRGLARICEDFAGNPGFPDIFTAFAMTPFYDAAQRLKDTVAARLAEHMVYSPFNIASPEMSAVSVPAVQLRLCPLCMSDDIKMYGHYYFHLSHHLQDITVCVKHKVPLLILPDKDIRREMPYPGAGVTADVDDLETAVLYAGNAIEQFKLSQKTMLKKCVCESCNRTFPLHPYSIRSGVGCPYCTERVNPEDLVKSRLQTLYGNEYSLIEFESLFSSSVQHKPCGRMRKSLYPLIWGHPEKCDYCRRLTPEKVLERIGDKSAEYSVHGFSQSPGGAKMVSVTHCKCGKRFDIIMRDFLVNPHCVFCDRKQPMIDISKIDNAYEIVSAYQNNRTTIKIRHKECGVVFRSSKTSFIAGSRCPICHNRLSYSALCEIVTKCAPSYQLKKHQKRGYAVVTKTDGTIVKEKMSYCAIEADLVAKDSSVFVEKTQIYEEPRSIRRVIFETIKEKTVEKGFWITKDGISGHNISANEQNVLQDMAKEGFITRVRRGVYKTPDIGDVYDT